MRSKYSNSLIFVFIILVLAVSACGGSNSNEVTSAEAITNQTNPENSTTANNSDTDQNANTSTEDNAPIIAPTSAFPPLGVERQAITIPTDDGRTLEGYYYPAATNPAPTIVMFHWAPGTLEDWQVMAPWLQNRDNDEPQQPVIGCDGRESNFLFGPWLDSSWFPTLTANASFNIVVFNFSGCGNSTGGSRTDRLADTKAALIATSQLEGVDPFQISTIGASIGADGAVDGCYQFNQSVDEGLAQGRCMGAFSLSPGDYLTMNYSEPVQYLNNQEPPITVVCLAAKNDGSSPAACREFEPNEEYEIYLFSGSSHGIQLLDPAQSPNDPPLDLNAMEIYVEFLEYIYKIDITQ